MNFGITIKPDSPVAQPILAVLLRTRSPILRANQTRTKVQKEQ